MKWKRLFVQLKTSFVWLSVVAMEQTAVNIYIPGVYRREWKDQDSGNVEVIAIKLRDNVTDIYELSSVKSRLVPHNERLVYNSEPKDFLAIYNAGTKQLFEIGGPRIISFLLSENMLLIDKKAFVKINGEIY